MAKHTLKILRLSHCKVFKTCFAHFSTLPMKGLMLVVNSLLTDKKANLKMEGIARSYAKTVPFRKTCEYQEVRNVRFSENLACFVLLLPPF